MNKKIFYLLIAVLIILGIGFRLFSLNKNFSAEETDFANAARAIANTKHPVYYHSEQVPKYVALWHPPMYIHLEAIIFYFTSNEIFLRSLNAIAILITGLLIYLLCSKIINGEKGKRIGLIASALFLVNYYVLSSSIIMDIDGLSTLFVFLFLFFICMHYYKKYDIYLIFAGIAFVFALANRYPIAILVFSCIFLYILSNKETRKFSAKYLILGIVSTAIFIIIWIFYRTIIQPGDLFVFLTHNATLGSQQFESFKLYISSFSLNIAQIIRLFTFPAVLLFILSFNHNIRKKDFFTRIILVYALSIFALFLLVPRPAFGYPRYFLTLMPGFFILISQYLYDKISILKIRKEHYILGILFFVGTLILLLVFNPQATIYRNDGLIKATNLPDFIVNILCSIPILFAFAFKKERRIILIIGLIALFFSYNLYFDFKYVENKSHIKEVAEYLEEHTDALDMVVCPNAVGYYYGKRFFANDYYKPSINNLSLSLVWRYFEETLKNPKMNNEFFWGKDIYGGIYCENYTRADDSVLNSKYVVVTYFNSELTPEKIIGDYNIYRMKE